MHRTLRAALLVMLILVAGAAAPAGVAERLDQEEALRLVGEIVPRVEALRGLSFRKEVPVEVVNDRAVREYALERVRRFGMEQRFEDLQRVYAKLGLVAEDARLLDLMLEALEEQAGGYYDPARGTYYLLDDMPPAAAPIFTAHELTHALEDQHFDLDRRLREALSNDDLLLARSAVHEGSATVLMTAFAMGEFMRGELDSGALMALAESDAGRAAKLKSLPDVLLRQMLGPYVLGAAFLSGGNLLSIVNGFPEEAANRVMHEGPTSSEQILHPEKYWEERDEPSEVRVDGGTLPEGWEVLYENTLGEIGLAMCTDPLKRRKGLKGQLAMLGAKYTNRAAEGWDGDRFLVLGNGDARVLVGHSVWDSSKDARQFASALDGLSAHVTAGVVEMARIRGVDGAGFRLRPDEAKQQVSFASWFGVELEEFEKVFNSVSFGVERRD